MSLTIRARVADLRRKPPTADDRLLIDTNVWFWLAYQRATQSPNPPSDRQVETYPQFISRAYRAGAALYAPSLSLLELWGLIERCEFDISRSRFPANNRKDCRHLYPEFRKGVAAEVKTAWDSISSICSVLDTPIPTADPAVIDHLADWACELSDICILNVARENGIVQVVSDDGDFAECPDVILHTTNPTLLYAARQAGRLTM